MIAPMERPPSPCIKVCELDTEGYCRGCLRTGTEIGQWLSMSPVQQWRLIADLERDARPDARISSLSPGSVMS